MTDRKLAAMPGAMAENFKTREAAAQGLREKWEVRDRSGPVVSAPQALQRPSCLSRLGRCGGF